MGSLTGKKIVLGVTGGIAAYKAVEIASRLRKAGAEVHVIMTREATEFVTELTFREITGQPVSTDMWAKVANFNVEHIALATLADLVLIAPATANIIAKTAAGIADDMLTTTVLATKAPIVMAPAMNTNMYENPVTQKNIAELKSRGVQMIEPASGHLACGVEGKGRLPEPAQIVQFIMDFMSGEQPLQGRKIIVTAGGTIEPLDPVRYLGNHSTGKMGYAIAAEAAKLGAEVLLVSGPSNLADPAGVKTVRIQTALEMQAAVQAAYAKADAVIMSAAVADYRPKTVAKDKIKKSDDELVLHLERNPDILYGLGQQKDKQILVGFAAETCNVEEYAKKKLSKKNLDFIVANDVSAKDAGFAVDNNRVQIYFRKGECEKYPLMSKQELAGIILNKIVEMM
ncbi:MAG: bifunctional phosphopantothenoylcysteine decarboxylase/phosphopantothenate--cysteine ligase CoaBC [Selenomonas ruminantium]|jgi:phosphopantothenoylcysteine decarboxylase/phosphopantothenate--cysteine ligase|uniref:Coenzyme A biosynthesis bifunctional protein CoaBC n=1 Tax=Selenomonas ruminantium TaxID=971 RepID=A0A927WFU5_SELRU|nr:bifunctional phosphopantothenoylcysteine decarboxylase/phosphopantothenate--cysteine ligase CoaBC [Selenomonas ruminantium]MBE6083991.1 bifunctional phosphopantothenoylcysteine decarboxylase/phosphopantothenate--cysteine ligase CoaBC [Selenomonas ruminantium]